MIGALTLLAMVQVEAPKTVNGDVLGSAADFRTQGPAKICMRDIAVSAQAGEAVYLGYAGIHSGTLRLVISTRYVDFAHGEIFAKPKKPLKLIEQRDGVGLYRAAGNPVRYVIVKAPHDGEGREVLIRISGTALTGNDADQALMKRLAVGDQNTTGCDRTYTYGWSMLFGDELLSVKKDP